MDRVSCELERSRFQFVMHRDGLEAALLFAIQSIGAYLDAVKGRRRKYGRHFRYRREYIESAWSFRALFAVWSRVPA